MSSLSLAITPAAFAIAIQDLPLANLHFKAAELRNSDAHLINSNDQLRPFADDGDQDCVDAIQENEEVLRRNEERLGLLRKEVENRGFRWGEAEVEDKEDAKEESSEGVVSRERVGTESTPVNGTSHERTTIAEAESTSNVTQRGGRLSDDELRRQLQLRMEAAGDDEDGVYL